MTNQFEDRSQLALLLDGRAIVHVDEVGRVADNMIGTELLLGGVFSQAHESNGRVREDHTGHIVITHLQVLLSSEDAKSHNSSLSDCHWSKVDLISCVSNCIDSLHIGILVLVNFDGSVTSELDSGVIELQPREIRLPSESRENLFSVNSLSRIQVNSEHAVVQLLNLRESNIKLRGQVELLHVALEDLNDI